RCACRWSRPATSSPSRPPPPSPRHRRCAGATRRSCAARSPRPVSRWRRSGTPRTGPGGSSWSSPGPCERGGSAGRSALLTGAGVEPTGGVGPLLRDGGVLPGGSVGDGPAVGGAAVEGASLVGGRPGLGLGRGERALSGAEVQGQAQQAAVPAHPGRTGAEGLPHLGGHVRGARGVLELDAGGLL